MNFYLYQHKLDRILGGFEYLHADNVIANAGAGGATFRTDDVGSGVQVPFAKLMDGTDGSSAVIPGDATNGLFVQVKASAIPTGAATAAKQPALGTAGTASADVITVQGVTSMTPLKTDGSGVTQPVSGTVTANAGTGTMAVSLASVPSHAVTNAGTFATQVDGAALTALQLIDNLVLAEDSVAQTADPGVAVFAVRRDSASAGGADGDYVNLSTDSTGALRVTGGGGGTQYAEDAAHASGDSGTMALVVRRDANTSLVGADGDYAPLQVDSTGNLKVAIISGAGSGGTSATDDAAFTVGSGSGTPIMGLADETSPDSVNEGDVGVVRMTLTRALHVNLRDSSGNELAAGNQYAEDVAHTTADLGTMALAVRRDANTSLVDTTGDYAPLQVDATGSLKVAIISGAGSGGTSATDDAAFTVASGSGTPIMGLADETSPDSVDEGDVGVVRMTLTRALHVNLRDSSGNELAAGNQYAEDAAHTSADLGTMALAVRKDTATALSGTDGDYTPLVTDASGRLHVNVGALPALATGTNNIGDVDVLTVPTDPFGANADSASATGSISAKLRFIASTGIPVTGTVTVGSHAVTNAGTFVVQAGTAAHDAAVSGNPVRVAGQARTSDYTAVASADTADFITDLNGKQVVLPYAIPENFISGATAAITDTTNTSVIASAGGSLRNYITHILVINSHATVGTVVELRDGASTVLYRGYAGPVGGGFSCTLPTPLRGTAATAITASCITTGSNTYVSASGYKAV